MSDAVDHDRAREIAERWNSYEIASKSDGNYLARAYLDGADQNAKLYERIDELSAENVALRTEATQYRNERAALIERLREATERSESRLAWIEDAVYAILAEHDKEVMPDDASRKGENLRSEASGEAPDDAPLPVASGSGTSGAKEA